MSAPLKLAAFAAALVLVFAGAALAGETIGPDRSEERVEREGGAHAEPEAGARATHARPAEGGTHTVEQVRGLAVADGDLKLDLGSTELRRGERGELRFAIVEHGERVRDFEVEHARRMHLIVVRRDGSAFRHLHPRLGADGAWSVSVSLSEAGSYRVFADFMRGGQARTLAADLTVDGRADYRALPEPGRSATAGGSYDVTLEESRALRAGREAELRFTVRRAGRVVRTEPYLGAGGHMVALRAGDLAFLHVHPAGHDGTVFITEFPTAGRYRLYLQFKHRGRVRTAEFTREVS